MKKDQEQKRVKKQKKKNTEIMVVTWFFTLLFLGMSGYITHYSVTHQQELINNSYNGRQEVLLAQNRRGTIYSSEGEVLAESIENPFPQKPDKNKCTCLRKQICHYHFKLI